MRGRAVTLEDILPLFPNAVAVRGGEYYLANCCFPDKHEGGADTKPSLLIYPDGFVCKGCGSKGTLAQLKKPAEQHYNGGATPIQNKAFTFPWYQWTDLDRLAEEAHKLLMIYPDMSTYLHKRGIAGRIEPNQLGYMLDWFVFPVRSRDKVTTHVVLRAGPGIQDSGVPRYVNSPGRAHVYVPDWRLFDRSSIVYVPFGVIDCLVLAEARYPTCCWTAGKDIPGDVFDDPMFTSKKTICLIPDKGEEDAARAVAARIGWRAKILNLKFPPAWKGAKDVADFAQRGRLQELHIQLATMS